MHHPVTLDALRVLQAIDQKGSFSAAASSLYKVPSALTYTVQKLEQDLGVALFDRRGQRAILTAAGQLVLDEGRHILQAAARLEDKVKQLDSGWEPQVVIAKDTIVPDAPLLTLLAEFCQLDKNVDVQIIEESLGGGWDALYNERADLAIGVTGELPKGQYQLQSIGEIEWVFAVSPQHPLADYIGLLEPQIISQYPAIVVRDSSRTLPQRSTGLFDSKQLITVSTMQAKLTAQMKGLGTGFLPLHLAQRHLEQGELIAKGTSIPRPPTPVYAAAAKHKDGRALSWLCEAIGRQNWLD